MSFLNIFKIKIAFLQVVCYFWHIYKILKIFYQNEDQKSIIFLRTRRKVMGIFSEELRELEE